MHYNKELKAKGLTKTDYQRYLDGLPIAVIPTDNLAKVVRFTKRFKYGQWLRRNTPILFDIGYHEWRREKEESGKSE